MGTTYCEQYPLLLEEFPEEEHHDREYHRRGRSMSYRSRSRNHMKGAVTIMTRWPDHWSTFVTYWWMGLGIICLTTLIIYNSLFSFSTFSSANSRPTNVRVSTTPYLSQKEPFLNHVYMHIVANKSTNADLINYIYLIEAIAKNYSSFCYHLIIVENDTLSKKDEFKAEENNQNALNMLFDGDINYRNQMRRVKKNILIEHISMTKFMNNSPARKYWRSLSDELVEFLIRVASIWEKGGIAFNPFILQSPWSFIYKEKLKDIMEKFKKKEIKYHFYNKIKLQKSSHSYKNNHKSVNNIQDIINNLENQDNVNDFPDDILIEAENKKASTVSAGKRRLLLSSANANIKNKYFPKIYNNNLIPDSTTINSGFKTADIIKYKDEIKTIMHKYNNTSLSLLPSFLTFLFHRYPENSDSDAFMARNKKGSRMTIGLSATEYETTTKLDILDKSILKAISKLDVGHKAPNFNPTFSSVEYSNQITDAKPKMINIQKNNSKDNNDSNKLAIDIRGNIIATETSCHAFLGTIFNNAVHQGKEDKLIDFIILQLSLFCTGVVSCKGVDLILLK